MRTTPRVGPHQGGARLAIATTVPDTFHFLHPYVTHFRDQGWAVDGISGDGVFPEDLRHSLSDVHRVPWSRSPSRPENLAAIPRMRQVLLSGGYDIVHTHTPVASFITRCAVASIPPTRRPAVVYTAHGFHFHPRGKRLSNVAYAGAEWLAGRWTSRLVVINETDHRMAAAAPLSR